MVERVGAGIPAGMDGLEVSSATPASPKSANLVQRLRGILAERELELHSSREAVAMLEAKLQHQHSPHSLPGAEAEVVSCKRALCKL